MGYDYDPKRDRNHFVVAEERRHEQERAQQGGSLGHLAVEITRAAGSARQRVTSWISQHHLLSAESQLAYASAPIAEDSEAA